MEGGGRQSRLLDRLLSRLRGDRRRFPTLDNRTSSVASGLSISTGCGTCGSTTNEEEEDIATQSDTPPGSGNVMDEEQFTSNIDLRYGGQYLTPEQLPLFCDQLHNLTEVIRNIQSYAKVTGEYPRKLERHLEQEALEVAALAAEARNARDVVRRTRAQRRAVRAQRKYLISHLASLRETEVRELESVVRLSDRKLFKAWEALKDATECSEFETLLDEVKHKKNALECLLRLIENRQAALLRTSPLQPTPLPPPPPPPPPTFNLNNNEGMQPSPLIEMPCVLSTPGASGGAKREGYRASAKRRRKEAAREPRSVPLSGESSHHGPQPQVTLFIQGAENSTSRYRVGSAGAVALTPIHLPSHGSVRDILFFTSTNP